MDQIIIWGKAATNVEGSTLSLVINLLSKNKLSWVSLENGLGTTQSVLRWDVTGGNRVWEIEFKRIGRVTC